MWDLSQALDELNPIHGRHVIIDHDEVEGAHGRLQQPRRRIGMVRHRHVGLSLQKAAQAQAHGRAVIDQQCVHPRIS